MGDRIGLSLTPDDIHVMKKSEYSGMYGDYSTFSDEMGEAETEGEGDSCGKVNASSGTWAEEEGGADEI